MSTFNDLVYTTKNKLDGAVGRDRINTLAAAISSTSATSLTVTYTPTPDLAAGSVIEIDYEQMLVMAVSTTTLTVLRGWNNTTAATHSNGAIVRVEPRFPQSTIFNELLTELRAIPRTIFQVVTTTLSFAAGINQVDLIGATGEVYRVLSAERASLDGIGYPSFIANVRLIRNLSTSDFASGYAIALDDGLSHGETASIRLTYAKSLTTSGLTTASDLQSVVGLPLSAEDILTFGAASRLMYDKEALRADIARQGQSRNAQEVPPDTNAKMAQRWRMEADRRISEEATRLLGLYGFRGA